MDSFLVKYKYLQLNKQNYRFQALQIILNFFFKFNTLLTHFFYCLCLVAVHETSNVLSGISKNSL